MLEFLKHIAPKTKILFLSMFLILIPGAIISYLSMKSIQEKADNQKVKYLETVNLVRDKLESELFQLESNFRNSVIDSLLKQEGEDPPLKLLQAAGKKNPAFKNLMLIGNNGELITSMTTLEVSKVSSSKNHINRELRGIISEAEKAEFIERNHFGAIDFYQKAIIHTISQAEGYTLSRIASHLISAQ
ncbi:MAG: hypothetical protein U9R49_02330 [Bacteroidota bacterium]|nr:hypothetical protein [Bacteroidota bacterium]